MHGCAAHQSFIADHAVDTHNYFLPICPADRNSLWLAVGLSLGLLVGVLLILVTVVGLCMLVSQCPLRKQYYSKPAVGPDDDEVGMVGVDS